MNAIDFLRKEHNKVRNLFADIADPVHRETTQKKIFETIHEELLRHEAMEQTVWYPHFKSDIRLSAEVRHLVSEEQMAKKLADRLDKIKNSKEWQKEIMKLQKEVEKHADEEEKILFPEVKKILNKSELERIGQEMKTFKKTY